jgi:hypothetical protein
MRAAPMVRNLKKKIDEGKRFLSTDYKNIAFKNSRYKTFKNIRVIGVIPQAPSRASSHLVRGWFLLLFFFDFVLKEFLKVPCMRGTQLKNSFILLILLILISLSKYFF